MVGISVLTEGISNETQIRFKHSVIVDGKPKVGCIVRDVDERKCNLWTEYKGKKYFNRNKGHNYAIKSFDVDVVICADVDLLVPEGFVDYSYKVALERPFFGIMRKLPKDANIEPRRWKDWLGIKEQKTAYGPWVAMRVDHWYACGGWNEKLFSWGLDKHMWDRVKHAGLNPLRHGDFPLVHIWHPRRNKNIDYIKPSIRKELSFENFLT